jgi:ABC-type nitrate/sulfonate/bicarbonate transport system substrate-binding protein
LAGALESGGLTVRYVDLRFVGYGEVGAAFERGELDGALLGEPLVSDLVARGLAVRLADDFVDGLQPTYLYCLRSMLEERRADVVSFVAGQLRTYADLSSGDVTRDWDAPDARAAISEFTDVPSERLPHAQRPYYDPLGRFHPESLERLYGFFVDSGYVEFTPSFDPASLIEADIVPEALALLERGDRQ